jgi:DNA-directed RNA polymerase subunit N (RpoN/RPB10)
MAPHRCFYCEKILNSRVDLGTHRKLCQNTFLHNKAVINFKCEKCCSYFKDSISLMTHLKNHQILEFSTLYQPFAVPPPPYASPFPHCVQTYCYTCGKSVDSKAELKRHYGESHSEIVLYWCEVCYTNFGSERGLKSHMRNIHQDFS